MPAPCIIPRAPHMHVKVWALATAAWRRDGEPMGPPGEQSYGRDSLLHTRGCNELCLITAFLPTRV